MQLDRFIKSEFEEYVRRTEKEPKESPLGLTNSILTKMLDHWNEINFYDFESTVLSTIKPINGDLENGLKVEAEKRLSNFESTIAPGVPWKIGSRDQSKSNLRSRNILSAKSLEDIKVRIDKHFQELEEDLKSSISNIELGQFNIEKSFKESRDIQVKKYEQEIDEIKKIYTSGIEDIENKNKQLDELLEAASGNVIAGDFSSSALQERKLADILRYCSIVCMLLIVVVVGYTFWETTVNEFQWQSSLFRVVLATFLSIPSAYLARESAKHREKQYLYHQMSLDLKTVTPFISSLPDESQNSLRYEMAKNMFSNKGVNHDNSDSYPINIQEIILGLMEKIKPSKDSEKNK